MNTNNIDTDNKCEIELERDLLTRKVFELTVKLQEAKVELAEFNNKHKPKKQMSARKIKKLYNSPFNKHGSL